MRMTKEQNKGITLIALVITIIVMLILVGVTITMAVDGGLFEKARSAATRTNEAKKQELLIAEGKIEVGGKVYNTLDEYVSSLKGGYVDKSALSVGDYVNYPVEYDNVSTQKDFPDDGDDGFVPEGGFPDLYPDAKYASRWRVLSTEGDNVRLISAGVPIRYEGYRVDINLDNCYSSSAVVHGFAADTYMEIFGNKYTYTEFGIRTMNGQDIMSLLGVNFLDHNTSLVFDEVPDLITVPMEEGSNEFATTWIDEEHGNGSRIIKTDGSLGSSSSPSGMGEPNWSNLGVRPVVLLRAGVKFKPAATKVNGTTTWDIEISDEDAKPKES